MVITIIQVCFFLITFCNEKSNSIVLAIIILTSKTEKLCKLTLNFIEVKFNKVNFVVNNPSW